MRSRLIVSDAMRRTAIVSAALAALCTLATVAQTTLDKGSGTERAPVYRVDPAWPKPLPNHWILGAVTGVAVDQQNHVWIIQRPSSVQPDEVRTIWRAAPPVLEFAPDGTLVSSWGGPGSGYDWPQLEHGIYVDRQDNVWLGGAGDKDAQILKFTRQGKFLLQIGHPGRGRGSNDTEDLGGPASMVVDEAANEVYVADGYINHRLIVFDATTGAYKRHWGAYGKRPDDSYYTQSAEKLPPPTAGASQPEGAKYDPSAPPSRQFSLVHSVRLSKDGLVYVCDRTNNRLQVFRKDGTFVQEAFIAKDTPRGGTVSDIGFSVDPRQRFAFVADSTNQQVYILDRRSLKVLSAFGGAGHRAGQFEIAHNMAVDSKGDLFVTESAGRRVQKFVQAGIRNPE
jgi:DNA-binding beta-propeller fold protein YncE